MDEPVYVVFNPHSGKGRGAQLVGPVLQALAPARRLEHGLTQGPGDEARLAEEAIRRGFRRIVAVGGDGTWSNVGNAILHAGLPAKLGLVPGGTGCDLAKTLGIPARDIAACCRIVLDGVSRRIDVGRIEDKHFLNIAGFGYDIAVIEDSWSVAYLEGGALYLYCALRQLRSFRGFTLEGEVDGRPLGRSNLLMLIVANARVFGGGFRIAPHAEVSDGKLEAVAFSDMGFAGRLSVLVRLLRGAHLSHPRVSAVSASRLVYRFAAPPAYETDGEWNLACSPEVVIEAVPGALEVLVPGR
ncbi:MAG TPA: diacylglycerol kinase family protein [Vicinamibacteria bacterium]|nr:diacylglycerol kinase family protein [Vicinamibacteria bacterium]